jgi:tetratricopeptide (TPR) repeat protein
MIRSYLKQALGDAAVAWFALPIGIIIASLFYATLSLAETPYIVRNILSSLFLIGYCVLALYLRFQFEGAISHKFALTGGSTVNSLEEHQQSNVINRRLANLEAELSSVKKRVSLERPNVIVPLLIVILVLLGGSIIYLSAYVYYPTVRNNELLAIELAAQVEALQSALLQTTPPQDADEQVQSLAQAVELLRIKVESELEASQVRMEAMRETNDRNFLLFAILGAIGSLLGGIIVFTTWFRERQESNQAGQMFELQKTNLSEVNKITAAIAEGAEQNVERLNTMLSTIQKIMDFKIAEVTNLQELVERAQSQLNELVKAQRQQVEDLLRNAMALRRPRFQYTNPDPDLQQRMKDFQRQMDAVPRVILDQNTGADSPKAERRAHGEIYLRRGVIAYLENDIVKSRQMLNIAQRFFPFSQEEIENMPLDQRISTAFTQFYLALIEKNYGNMASALDYINKSYAVYGQKEPGELLTLTTRAEILSYLDSMDIARDAIRKVLERADALRMVKPLERHDANSAFRAHLLLGNTYYIERAWDQALEHYQTALVEDVHKANSYYALYSIAQVYHQKDDKKESEDYESQAYYELINTGHLRMKVALDTHILLNALAYLCTRDARPEEAQVYKEVVRGLWLRIHEVNGLQLRLFSFKKKRPVSKDEFWTEIFG